MADPDITVSVMEHSDASACHENTTENMQHTDQEVENEHSGNSTGAATPKDDTGASAVVPTSEDEEEVLAHLTTKIQDQDDLERTVARQADEMMLTEANERDAKRLEKSHQQKARVNRELHALVRKAKDVTTSGAASLVKASIEAKEKELAAIYQDIERTKLRLENRQHEAEAADALEKTDQPANQQRPGETKREFLIRTGKITPFSKLGQSLANPPSNLAEALLDAEGSSQEDDEHGTQAQHEDFEPLSHRNLLEPGFAQDVSSSIESTPAIQTGTPPKKKRRLQRGAKKTQKRESRPSSATGHTSDGDSIDQTNDVHVSVEASDVESDGPGFMGEMTDAQASRASKKRTSSKISNDTRASTQKDDLTGIDDGNETMYQQRLNDWLTSRQAARTKALSKAGHIYIESEDVADDIVDEWRQPHPTRDDGDFGDGFRVPGDIFPSLFDYQKTGVKWLWQLHQQSVGGILADEMGLGKTIQIISLLAGLHYSGKYEKPTIVVVPATLMKQWVNEFHRWWPAFRVSILHSTGSGMLDLRSEGGQEDRLENHKSRPGKSKASPAARKIVNRVLKDGHVLITTYAGLQANADILIGVKWGYAILDEGHKIRNPNVTITMYCKELQTANRIILSGTPMQNNLVELWSLFDFVYPMRLGTLVKFREHFVNPIRQGGYANASSVAVEIARSCAQALKDSIGPYLMQRWKSDVAADLPAKSEQVLFCQLTRPQRQAYDRFLASRETQAILDGKLQAFYGIDLLRKICNHPDLTEHKTLSNKPGYDYGSGSKSGKMQVVKSLLRLWKKEGHKTLLFTQHRIMLDILQKYVKKIGGINYIRMDGTTAIKDRQSLVDRFNKDPELNVFLLTTKVGGLGVNLTGADRVIIYDPDWNPSTDMQAQERAWRLGQQRDVVIYRLMIGGTIEEKIYHRQLFKSFLTNKIMKDPSQRSNFHLKGLQDLFTFGKVEGGGTETGALFEGSETRIKRSDDEDYLSGIDGISRQETFKGDQDQSSHSSTRKGSPSSDGDATSTAPHLLEDLLSKSGVHAALSHDVIIGGKKIQLDRTAITAQANRVAAGHAREIQRARDAATDVPIGVPTWTGTVGTAGRPATPPPRPVPRAVRDGPVRGRPDRGSAVRGGSNRELSVRESRGGRSAGGPSSRAVLANLSSRQVQDVGPTDGSNSANDVDEEESAMDFFESIPNYFHAHGGRVYSRMMIDHFQRLCNTPEKRQEFKDKLKRVAVVDRSLPGASARAAALARERGRAVIQNGTMSLGSNRVSTADEDTGRTMWVLKKAFGGTA